MYLPVSSPGYATECTVMLLLLFINLYLFFPFFPLLADYLVKHWNTGLLAPQEMFGKYCVNFN